MRIAFEVFGGPGWMGGINYLANLLTAISELPGRPITPVLFTGPDVDPEILSRLSPYLFEPPMQSAAWSNSAWAKRWRTVGALALRRDFAAARAFKDASIDLVFAHATWYGSRFPFPTLVWIGDFQHRVLPHMFSAVRYWKREMGFRMLTRYGTTIMASSETGCHECETFYPAARGKLAALPFVVRVPDDAMIVSPQDVRRRYNLPEKFFFMPNQFWRHKNHLGVIEALHLLKQEGQEVVVAVPGSSSDPRDPRHFPALVDKVKYYGLEGNFRLLGMIPCLDLFSLMRASIGLLNPSFYEGWSTTVEEAKSIGVPLFLSNLPVHREQVGNDCLYFDPANPFNVAEVLARAWVQGWPGPHLELEARAAEQIEQRRLDFATNFLIIAEQTVQKFYGRVGSYAEA